MFFKGWLDLKWYEGEANMKNWECVQVGHHKNIGETIKEWQENGWRLHSYQATGPLAQKMK